MSEHEFDKYADNYQKILESTLSIGGGDSTYYAEQKFSALKLFYDRKRYKQPSTILDFGCGTGINLPFLRKLFIDASLYGIDLSERSIHIAKDRNIPNCNLSVYDGNDIPYETEKFDLVIISNVLHHIDPPQRKKTLKLISNSIKASGLLVIFEHNPYNPLTCKIVRDCPFDKGVTLVKPLTIKKTLVSLGYDVNNIWSINFFPPFLKKIVFLEKFLYRLPLDAQYALFANFQKKSS